MPVQGYGSFSPLTTAQIQTLITPVFTLGSALTVTSTSSGTGGAVQVTFSAAHGLTAGAVNYMLLAGIGGTTEANGLFAVTVVSSTAVLLTGTTYVHAFTSGGTGQVMGHTNDVGSMMPSQLAQLLDAVDRVPRLEGANLYVRFPVGSPNP